MARGLKAAVSCPSCQAAPLRASIEKGLRELLGVVLHVNPEPLTSGTEEITLVGPYREAENGIPQIESKICHSGR